MAPAESKSFSEPSSAVYRPADSGPSSSPSSHTEVSSSTLLIEDDHRSRTPPPYSGPSTSSITLPHEPAPDTVHPDLPKLKYSLYSPQAFILSKDKTTLTSDQRLLSSKPKELLTLIQLLATVPPKPEVRIKGEKGGTVHFDIKINLMNLIVPDEGSKNSMNYIKLIGPGEMGWRGDVKETTTPMLTSLEDWARKFCQDTSSIKQFTLERTVVNWDTSYIEGRLLSLISSTSYKGHVTITFPLTHNLVVVRSPDKVNRFFSNVTSLFVGTKKYEVIKSVWPYANIERGEPGRRCVVQSEDAWLNDWKSVIKYAVVGRRQGWLTAENKLELLMEPVIGEQQVKPPDWETE